MHFSTLCCTIHVIRLQKPDKYCTICLQFVFYGVIFVFFFLEDKKGLYEGRTGKALVSTPHLHHHIEVILIEEGASVGVADTREAEMGRGDLYISFPNQIHYYLDVIRPVNHKIIIVSPGMCPEFSHIFKSLVPESPVLKNAASNERIVSAIDSIIHCRQNKDEYADAEVRGSMLILMSELCRSMPLVEKVHCDDDMVKAIINYCYENYTGEISLQSIADALHISRFYVSRLFGQRLHISFNDYINSMRVRLAAEMLKSGDKTITEVAYAVGYNSVRTFDRCFLKERGMTPKEYKSQAMAKKKPTNP